MKRIGERMMARAATWTADLRRLFMLGVLGVVGAIFGVTGAAGAEIAPYAQETWGVYNPVTSGTLTDVIRNEVFAIEQIGNHIYVGGKFTQVRSPGGGQVVTQRYLAAFDATTGAHIPTFTPVLDRPVYSLQASPDGSRLFVGGEFGDVGGVANTRALVALNPTTGAVDTTWKAQLKLDGRAVVYALETDGTWLYAGGTFSAVGGADGVAQRPASRAVKLRLSDARPDDSWRPVVSGGAIWGIAVSPDRNTVYLSGYFSSVNFLGGTQGFVGVDNGTGTTVRPGRIAHNGSRPFYLDVEVANNLVFVAGMEHIVWVLNANSNLSVVTRHSTGGTTNATFQLGGDYQVLERVGDRVYAGCHCRGEHFADGDVYRGTPFSRRDPIRFVAAYSATTGAYIPSFRLDVSGSSGAWALHGSPDGCLWIGGDLTRATRANGTNQARGGFTRHCDTNFVGGDTVRPSTVTGLAVTTSGSQAQLSWNPATDNVGVTGYEVYRAPANGAEGTRIATSTTTGYTDTGLAPGTYWYYIRAYDAAGNVGWRNGHVAGTIGAAADTERPSTVTQMVVSVSGSSAVLSWAPATDNVGVTRYNVYRSTSENGVYVVAGSPSGTSFTDAGLAAGTYFYYVRAVDAAGNEGWRNGIQSVTIGGGGGGVDTERPSTPSGLRVVGVGPGSVSLTWNPSTDNVGVTQYVITNEATGQIVATSTGTSVTVTGLAPGTTVTLHVRADDAAGNRSWRSNLVTATPQ